MTNTKPGLHFQSMTLPRWRRLDGPKLCRCVSRFRSSLDRIGFPRHVVLIEEFPAKNLQTVWRGKANSLDMTYEQWDVIADAYTPVLGLLCLSLLLRPLVMRDRRMAAIRTLHLGTGLFIAYGLMLLDNAFEIWAGVGLDYSTHSALSLVFVTYLCIHAPELMVLWDVSLLLYFVLIVYQQYHSPGDLFTTTFAVMVSLYVTYSFLRRFNK